MDYGEHRMQLGREDNLERKRREIGAKHRAD
jgi:hypothetical protein